ncbi:MAG: transglycosylase domain-containing protein [Kofleriaceae bacterium]
MNHRAPALVVRRPRIRRGWLIGGGIAAGVTAIVLLGLFVLYPRVGASKIRAKVTEKVRAKLGRDAGIRDIEVELGHAVIHDLVIVGPLDGDRPLVHVSRIDIPFDAWGSLLGSIKVGAVTVDGVNVSIRRTADGLDNVSDIVARLRGKDDAATAQAGSSSGLRPTAVAVDKIQVHAIDERTGAKLDIASGNAAWAPGEVTARALGASVTTRQGPRATAATLMVSKVSGQPPHVTVEGGEMAVTPRLALSGIGGEITANPNRAGEYVIDLAGGYGGVPGKLWTAKGGLDPSASTASLDLVAAKFQLDRLSQILEHSPLVNYANTSVDTKLHIDVDRNGGKFLGDFHVRGLNVGHPMIADREVHDLDLSAHVAGSFDRVARTAELTQGDFVVRDVPFSITGSVTQQRHTPERIRQAVEAAAQRAANPGGRSGRRGSSRRTPKQPVVAAMAATPSVEPPYGPGGINTLTLHWVVPKIDCNRALAAIPPEMAPYLQGYKLKGKFDVDLKLAIDWADLDATQLGGRVGINGCTVLEEPEDTGPKRLEKEFEHYVEVEENEWVSFIVGPKNDDFVPLDQISPYLVKSITTTEDGAFFQHHGFITSEFRTALVNNLKAGTFTHGASSITMQFVKNVLLYREKTLARKLQELFLTWHVEHTLTKERILEIYFNVIEYGPGLYGIGPASWHFFSKPPKDLNPVEAAFFSTILPSPKLRYQQYCANTLTRWTTSKIHRILDLMRKRDRLTQAEYDAAIATPLIFAKDNSETEDQCRKRVKKAIKNARPTNPMKK